MQTSAHSIASGKYRHLLGEGPRWVDDALYWVDIEAGELWRSRDGGATECVLKLPYQIGSFASTGEGQWVLATRHGFERFDVTTQEVMRILDPQPTPDTRFNDGRVDPRGRFWAGTMALDPARYAEPLGSLYCLDIDGTVTEKVRGLTISNGIDWSNDGTTLYLNDTMRSLIWSFDFDSETGGVTNPRQFARIENSSGFPDGLVVDADDHIWVALIEAGKVVRYSPVGKVSREITVGTPWPTSLTFGGADLSTLYITTSRHLMPAHDRNSLAGAVLAWPTEFRGRPERACGVVANEHLLREARPLCLPAAICR